MRGLPSHAARPARWNGTIPIRFAYRNAVRLARARRPATPTSSGVGGRAGGPTRQRRRRASGSRRDDRPVHIPVTRASRTVWRPAASGGRWHAAAAGRSDRRARPARRRPALEAAVPLAAPAWRGTLESWTRSGSWMSWTARRSACSHPAPTRHSTTGPATTGKIATAARRPTDRPGCRPRPRSATPRCRRRFSSSRAGEPVRACGRRAACQPVRAGLETVARPNPFALDADDAADPNPFAPSRPQRPGVPAGSPRKLGLLGRGLAVFGSYAKVLLVDDGLGERPVAYAQFGPLSAYPRALRLRELYRSSPTRRSRR